MVKFFNQFYQAIIVFEPLAGLEPATFSLQVSGSTNWAKGAKFSCGSEIRTLVVQLMRLSWDHLQSIPRFSNANGTRTRTPALKGQSPNQLVYSAILNFAAYNGYDTFILYEWQSCSSPRGLEAQIMRSIRESNPYLMIDSQPF